MYDNLKKSDMDKITKMINQDGAQAIWVDMSGKFDNLFTGAWSSTAVYFPLALSSICNDDRVLFLDADTMVTGDLTELYNQNLNGYYVAAVHDYGMVSNINSGELIKIDETNEITAGEYFENHLNWNADEMKKYFNSGMILMNLKSMREDNVEEKIFQSLKDRVFAFPDQDCINYICHDKVKIMEPRYNFMVLHNGTWKNLKPEVQASLLKYKDEKETPLIVHFLRKPWRAPADNVSFSMLYYKVKTQTTYENHRSRQETFQFRWGRKRKYLRILNRTIFSF